MPSFNVTTASQLAIPAKPRNLLIMQNVSDADIYFSFRPNVTAAAGANSGIKLAVNASITMTDTESKALNDQPVYAVHAGTGNKELRFLEA